MGKQNLLGVVVVAVGLTLLSLAGEGRAALAHVTNHWHGGFRMEISVTFCKDVNGWRIRLVFDTDLNTLEAWVGDVKKVNSREFVISNNGPQKAGATLDMVVVGRGTSGDIAPKVTATVRGCKGSTSTGTGTGGTGTGSGTSTGNTAKPDLPSTGGGSSSKDYSDALGKSILFFNAQRSGKLPKKNPIPWRGDSALNDCVQGGWYDAGDHVKYGLPFGSATMLLLWGMNSFKGGYKKAGQVDQFFDMVKWATDYMLAAWNPSAKELVVQIGEGAIDHTYWGRPEDMTMNRPCHKLSRSCSDIAGEWAGALAAASMAFKDKGDTTYANQLLKAAKSLYTFAKASPGKYTDVLTMASGFYGSSGYKDEMCLGAMWLYKATKKGGYLADAKGYHENKHAWALSWDDKAVMCQLMLYEATKQDTYKKEVEGFMKGWMPGGQVAYTPCGLAWRDKWGANRYAGNAAFVALAAAEAGLGTAKYRTWAVEQINYMLGDNRHDGGCFSYAIGVGNKYPKQPHHRGASCPDKPQPCGDAQRDAPGPSPQVLYGALVGGPDQGDNYKDIRKDHVANEVALDYNAGYTSALAGIVHLQATKNFPVTNNKCPCNQ